MRKGGLPCPSPRPETHTLVMRRTILWTLCHSQGEGLGHNLLGLALPKLRREGEVVDPDGREFGGAGDGGRAVVVLHKVQTLGQFALLLEHGYRAPGCRHQE